MMQRAIRLPFLGASLAFFVLAACAGKLEQPQRFVAAAQKYTGGGAGGSVAGTGASTLVPSECVLEIFKGSCGLEGCHAKGSPQIDLVSDGVAARLIDHESGSTVCKGRTYIATDGTSSLLLDKLSSSPPCGTRMPLGGTISAANALCLADWVAALGGIGLDAGETP
jgi:hypothetical protein